MTADMSEGYLKWHESLSPSHCRQYTAWQIAEQAFQAGAAWQAAQQVQVSELPDYFYNVDDWETTDEDESVVLDNLNYCKDGVLTLGRLKELPRKYVIQVYNETDEEYEYKYFDTKEAALAAIQGGK